MNESTAEVLLDKAKWGALSPDEMRAVEEAFVTGDPGASAYTLLHIIGRAGRPDRHEAVVAPLLDDLRDPAVTALALKILVDWWGLMPGYKEQTLRFLSGDPRDETEDILDAAMSAAAEYLRENVDRDLAEGLWNASPSFETQRAAKVLLLARTLGTPWQDLPDEDDVDLDGAWTADVRSRFRRRMDALPPSGR